MPLGDCHNWGVGTGGLFHAADSATAPSALGGAGGAFLRGAYAPPRVAAGDPPGKTAIPRTIVIVQAHFAGFWSFFGTNGASIHQPSPSGHKR